MFMIENPDEIILEDVKMFHYEVMEQGSGKYRTLDELE